MTSNSSYLPRLSFSRGDGSGLPFHNKTSPPIRKQPSEYAMDELSPRPEDSVFSEQTRRRASPEQPSSPTAHRYTDHPSPSGSDSKTKPPTRGFLAGPPAPIVRSRLLHRDEEDGDSSSHRPHLDPAASFRTALTSMSSVLFDRAASSSRAITRAKDRQTYEPDTIWRNLQRRERTLQKELQHLLDVQSIGLAAYLHPNAAASASSRSDLSDAGSNTPTGASRIASRDDRHVAFNDVYGDEVVVPVRQPRRKPMGLSAARTALGRNMALLADLKAEEDAVLTAALGTRKKALAQLRRLAGRREGLVEELKVLEADAQEPLGQELKELDNERKAVTSEIAELEERLVGLRNRKRWLDGRFEDIKNRKEAGLSGYRNALREVDNGVDSLLKRPPVKPLDMEVISSGSRENGEDDNQMEQSPGGVEFLRLRPERRTIEMARDWWESEIKILEKRRLEVDKDRKALEEGVDIWRDAVQLVADFETSLRQELKGEQPDDGKGKSKERTPEEAMHAQLDKMADVMAGLDRKLRIAEEQGWNLLLCAIGAELEAFRVGEMMLRDALKAAGHAEDEGDTDRTPQLGRSMSGTVSFVRQNSNPVKQSLVDMHEDTKASASESDNEVPPDLLVDTNDDDDDNDHDPDDEHGAQYQPPPTTKKRSITSYANDEEDVGEQSENEVPPEFITEHPKEAKLD